MIEKFCKNCDTVTERYAGDSKCKICVRARNAAALKIHGKEYGARRKPRVISAELASKPCETCGSYRRYERGDCADCANARARSRYYALDKDARRERSRKGRFRTYKLTEDQYQEMFDRQGGMCANCLHLPGVHVDHCHETGKVRGILCLDCNVGLGHFRDDPSLLRAAAEYLERHKQTVS